MEKVAVINDLYFEQKLSLTEIAKKLSVSISYISKILRSNKRYTIEKEKRKQDNLKQRRKKQREMIYSNRKNYIDIEYINMKEQHKQDSLEMSRQSTIGNTALRKWCSSAYNYNANKKRYEFDTKNLSKPADFPLHIKT